MDGHTVSLGLLAQLALLASALALGHWLERRKVRWFGGAAAAMLLGLLMSLALRLSGAGAGFKSLVAFKDDFFLYALLPPIVFEACFSMDVRLFLNNIGAICALAFAGTTISMILIGLNMWLAGLLGLCYKLSLTMSMLFGAMISATDPVTVLSLFKTLGADEDLHMIVFGESILNDAVGMVLFQTVQKMLKSKGDITFSDYLGGFVTFSVIFVSSVAVGAAIGLLASVVARTGFLKSPPGNGEAGFIVVCGYLAYLMAQAWQLSGIVSIMFCAIVMAHLTRPNLSENAARQLEDFFQVAATLAETFVFIYMGTLLFVEPQEWHTWRFLAISLLALAHSRAACVWPLMWLTNKFRPPELHVSKEKKFMLWWSGLRGGMAFAMAVSAAQLYGEDGRVMMTCTFLICFVTVLVNGGCSAWLLEKLQLQQGARYRAILSEERPLVHSSSSQEFHAYPSPTHSLLPSLIPLASTSPFHPSRQHSDEASFDITKLNAKQLSFGPDRSMP